MSSHVGVLRRVPRVRVPAHFRARLARLAVCVLPLAGCARHEAPSRTSVDWVAGHAQPPFDPDGPPDALRWAIERELSVGLVERDSTGHVVPALAESIAVAPDSLTWTFHLHPGLRFTDGSALASGDVRAALLAGLGREDHATRAWLLGNVAGIGAARPGRHPVAIGIEAPDPRTLVLRLARRDPRLLEKLAVPGVSTPWKRRSGDWPDAVGSGPYKVGAAIPGRSLTLVAAGMAGVARPLADTLHVRFVVGGARVQSVLRLGHADLVWPLPPGVDGRSLPPGWSYATPAALPPRRVLLVLRADVPPLHRAEARLALARAVHHDDLVAALGPGAEPIRAWLPGAHEPYEWPPLESPADRQARLAAEAARSRPAAPAREAMHAQVESFHVVLGYDADGPGGAVAGPLQAQWALAGHYAQLRPLRGAEAGRTPLAATAPQALVVTTQALLPGLGPELAGLVMPIRGPAVGSVRTGWRTRALDAVIAGSGTADPDSVQRALAATRIVLPIANLPWRMAIRDGGRGPIVHPAMGPSWITVNSRRGDLRTR